MDRLAFRTFGSTEALRAGRPIRWAGRNAERCFHYLLSHPEGRSKAQIIDALWALEVDDHSSNHFRVTLHRLRLALGERDAVREIHGRYGLAQAVLQATDVHAMYQAIEDASRARTHESRITALQRALAVYRGDYLPGQDETWAQTARAQHQAAYVQANLDLAAAYCQTRQCQLSVQALTTAVRTDPYLGENEHQLLMTCLSTVEGRHAAIEHYRRLLHFLRQEVHDEPIDDTVALAMRIKAGEAICWHDERREHETDHHLTFLQMAES